MSRSASLALFALLALGLAGCGLTGRQPIDEPLPNLPRRDLPPGDDDKPTIRIENGELGPMEASLTLLPAGASTLLVVNVVEGAEVAEDGMDLTRQAVALWLRGRGSQRHLRPEFTIGPLNAGVQEDWYVDLPPGDYLLTVTSGGESEAIILVR